VSEELGDDAVSVIHQTLRREVNEQIRKLGPGSSIGPPDTIEAVCECAYVGCTSRVELGVPNYEEVRRFPSRFVVKAGHEVSLLERVVAESDTYVIVEKVGRAGIYAVRVDPRRRGSGARTS
jgi:hypothetical protein